jgi:hypothetical protein
MSGLATAPGSAVLIRQLAYDEAEEAIHAGSRELDHEGAEPADEHDERGVVVASHEERRRHRRERAAEHARLMGALQQHDEDGTVGRADVLLEARSEVRLKSEVAEDVRLEGRVRQQHGDVHATDLQRLTGKQPLDLPIVVARSW